RHGAGDDGALAEAIASVHEDLRRIASRCLSREPSTPTFDAESLAQETFLRLVAHDRTAWQNRRQLFAVAVRIMRRILVDRARAKRSTKRGAGAHATTFDGNAIAGPGRSLDVRALDDALVDLARHDEMLAELVELRFFGGLSNGEIAELQGVTSMTVIRRWRLARAWLERYLSRRAMR
ncbi:MAG: ECF-type sigma factor, partial [Acidobacteriota bacterium]